MKKIWNNEKTYAPLYENLPDNINKNQRNLLKILTIWFIV